MRLTVASLVSLAALASPVLATTVSYDFDGVAAGSPANSIPASPLGERFHPAIFLPDVDMFGDDIPGTERWRIDEFAPALTVENPLTLNRGTAPSGLNMLDARFQPVLIIFSTAINLDPAGFSITLDNDTFGSNGLPGGFGDIEIAFYDPAGLLLLETPINQTVPGLIVAAGSLQNVGSIYLAGGALYDNLTISGVPVPAPAAASLLAAALLPRRRRSR